MGRGQLNAGVNGLKEFTTKSTWVLRSVVFSMHMFNGWQHQSCDSLARSVFPSCWVLSAIFFVFLCVFLLSEQFVTVVVDFVIFCCFFVCFFEGLVHMPHNTVNSVPSIYTSTSTACCSSSSAGSVTVPLFLSTYSSVGIPVVPRASQSPVLALSASSLFDCSLVPSTSSLTLAPSVGSGAFVELADLLAENIGAQEAGPHTYLDGKLLVACAKKGW